MTEAGLRSKPVLLKRGDAVPQNAILMQDDEVLIYQMQRLKNIQPQSEVRALNYGIYTLGACAGLSGFIIASTMRRNFKLGGLRKMLTYGPTVAVCGGLAGIVHEFNVKQSILLGKESCVTCVALRSGFYQATLGVGYTFIVSFLTCVLTAREYYTLPMPQASKGMVFLRLVRQVSPTANVLLMLGLFNMFIGASLAQKEFKLFVKYFSHSTSNDVVLNEEFLKE
ncbi:unnamed protein product [Lymnaea stagnalis]|uniref:Uncharacterized protein n=1 Tax=Lymnaea stagnalis TaxID=6523 RepID=A0AAV2HHJ8_LYMST